MNRSIFFTLLIGLILMLSGCEFFPEKEIIDDGRAIRFVFDVGLNDDPNFRLPKDKNGFYSMTLTKSGQNVQRISVRLLDGDKVVYSKCCGRRHSLSWRSNLYWWMLKGDTVANITKTYFNPFTGEIQYVNYPPLINWKDELVPTINSSSITDENTGRTSTVIAPIGIMRGDTMTVYVRYYHAITKWTEGSSFFSTIGEREITDSIKIILN